jgi:hypothetical protein
LDGTADLVAADLMMGGDKNHSRTRLLRLAGEGVQQGYYTGVSGCNSKRNRPGDGERDDKSNQQTSQDRPAFPSLQQQEKKRLKSDLHC